jgi:uncharacterized membrane protein
MSFWTAIVIIVAIAAITSIMRSRHRGSRRLEMHGQAKQSAREKMLENEVEDLRERIKVLERIATDRNSLDAVETKRIAAEIEALRGENKQQSQGS